ncbi:MAG TPA: hypothetical protein VHK69_01090 [Chitinophagaceae bacterium]|jgi:hypothetical protein|nr:hypothetical protein [Chitinophagaceae bacterium]
MKKVHLFLMGCLTLMLAGCFEITEELTIAENGSGTYENKMDMSGLFDMMEMAASMDTSASTKEGLDKLKEKIDTTISMSSFSDTASNLTADQKALMKNAKMRLRINQEAKEMKMDMNYPFTQLSDVQQLMKLNGEGGSFKMLGKAMKGEQNEMMGGDEGTPGMPDLSSFFDYTYRNGLLERRFSEAKFKEASSSEKFKEFQQAAPMMESVKMNTVIHLPRAAKKAEGTGVKLSSDRKTVTISASLSDIASDPKVLGYRVEY